MTRLVGISGSLRKASFNTALLRAAVGLVPDGTTLDAHTIHGIPLYDADLEREQGTPEAVFRLKQAILAADGLLLVTPEYNNSMPGVFKNAVDWLSSPTPGVPDVFRNRPVAMIGASPGGFGTILSQNAWLAVLRTLATRPWLEGRLLVSHARTVFDEAGALKDAKVEDQLRQFLKGFSAFAAAKG